MSFFKSAIVLSTLAVSALAGASKHEKRDDSCISYDEAQKLAYAYGALIANYTDALAETVLATTFTDYSESVNSLINGCPQGDAAKAITLPLLAPTFSNRTQFEIGQGQQPSINFNMLAIWSSCSEVILRWETTNTAPIPNVRPVIGLIVLETIPNNIGTADQYPYIVDTVYSEFDAAAWLQNLMDWGICATSSNSTSTPSATASYASTITQVVYTTIDTTQAITSTIYVK